MRKSFLVAAMTAAAAAMTFSTQASAGDPVAGAIIGGGIGAAVAGPPGAAVGAIIGTIAGAADPYYYRHGYRGPGYDGRRYYGPAPAYYPPAPAYYPPAQAYYPPAQAYYAPATEYYAPPPAYYAPPVIYRSARAYAYEPRYVRQDRHYDARGDRHEGRRYRDGYDRGYR
jgi:hypothetical protein